MTTMTKSETTIANILGAAASLFTARNYADVTMDQISLACNVTKGALYHHFTSKEELYLALMHSDLERKRGLFEAAVAAGRDCRDRLRRLTAVFFDLPQESRELMRLVRRDINIFGEPARTGLVQAYQASLPELIEGVIRDGIRDGEMEPTEPRQLSWHFVALVEVMLSDCADRSFQDADAKLDYVMELFFRGAGPRQGANE
jgi:AcrR family transcriptional regulator